MAKIAKNLIIISNLYHTYISSNLQYPVWLSLHSSIPFSLSLSLHVVVCVAWSENEPWFGPQHPNHVSLSPLGSLLTLSKPLNQHMFLFRIISCFLHGWTWCDIWSIFFSPYARIKKPTRPVGQPAKKYGVHLIESGDNLSPVTNRSLSIQPNPAAKTSSFSIVHPSHDRREINHYAGK